MIHIYSWRKDPFSHKRVVGLSEEVKGLIEDIKDLWTIAGEKIIHDEYGIVRVEKDGDLVIRDIDYFLERIGEHKEADKGQEVDDDDGDDSDLFGDYDDIFDDDYDDYDDY